MYIHTYIHFNMDTYIHTYTKIHMHTFIHTYIHINKKLFVCILRDKSFRHIILAYSM